MIPEDDIEDVTQTAKQDDERVEDRSDEPGVKNQKTAGRKAAGSNVEKKQATRKPRVNKMDEEKSKSKRPSSLFDFGIKQNPSATSDPLTSKQLDIEAPPVAKRQPASSSQIGKKLSHKDHPDAIDLEVATGLQSSSLVADIRPPKRTMKPFDPRLPQGQRRTRRDSLVPAAAA